MQYWVYPAAPDLSRLCVEDYLIAGMLGWKCRHHKNYHLKSSETSSFKRVDSTGNVVQGQELGLLLYKGDTVCRYNFDNFAADAICRQMKYTHSSRWTSGRGFDVQVSVNLLLVVTF